MRFLKIFLFVCVTSVHGYAQTYLDFLIPQEIVFSAGYQAILDRCGATVGCVTPSYDQQIRQNILYNSLPSGIDVFYNFATDGNESFALINWITPASFKSSVVNAPTHTRNQGYYGNGTNSYVNTNWNPFSNGVNYTQNNASLFAYVINNTAGSNTMASFGTSGASTIGILIPRNVNNLTDFRINSASATSDTQATTASDGLWMVRRINNTQVSLFRNGSLVVTASETSTGRPTNTLYLEALNNAGTAGFFSSRGVSMAGTGNGLNGNEAALNTAWNTYITSINVWGNTSEQIGSTSVTFNN